MGPVKEIFYGAEHPQAKSFKAQAIEVSVHYAGMYVKCNAAAAHYFIGGR